MVVHRADVAEAGFAEALREVDAVPHPSMRLTAATGIAQDCVLREPAQSRLPYRGPPDEPPARPEPIRRSHVSMPAPAPLRSRVMRQVPGGDPLQVGYDKAVDVSRFKYPTKFG